MKTKYILILMTFSHVLISALSGFLVVEPSVITQKAIFYFVVSAMCALSACMFGLYSLRAVAVSKNRQ